MHNAEHSDVLAGVVVALPPDLEAEALRTREFGLPAEVLHLFGGVEGMPVFVYLFRTQVRCGPLPCCRCRTAASVVRGSKERGKERGLRRFAASRRHNQCRTG